MTTSVLIPTYVRPDVLAQCVASILKGSVLPNEVVIVGRKGDRETEQAVAALEAGAPGSVRIRSAWVTEPGHVPPVREGARAATGDLVAIVDDDVTVTPEWLSFLVTHFGDPAVGVVGGRVLVPGAPLPKLKGRPGCISWYGKVWGNVGSLNAASSLEVDSVMECNWMWRRALLASIEFDPILNFDDASMYGLDLCLQAKMRGYKVVFDPRAVVHHHVAPRTPELDRQQRGPRLFSFCRNYTYIFLKRFPIWRSVIFLVWWFLIGERGAWGLGALALDKLSGGSSERYVGYAWRGKIEGVRLYRESNR